MITRRQPASRPLPVFNEEMKVLSTKKERAQTERKFRPPPSPQFARVKSTFQASRVRSRLPVEQPAVVSFRDDSSNSSAFLSNSFYDRASHHTFLDQCFEERQLIGTGCFGNVYSVRSKLDGRRYAVKKSRQPFKSDGDRRRRLEEVRRHERLPPHRHCVQFYTAWEEADYLYMLTELCGRSLAEICESSHRISESTVWDYMVDLLLALQHLHSNQLMHLDIKPDNIFISQEGFCKLGDFGLVADVRHEQSAAVVSNWAADLMEGDPRYLAPELMAGRFSPAADVFSLGVSLLELACDLDVPSGSAGWHQLRDGRPLPEQLTAGLSHQLRTVLQAMLRPDPLLRPSAAELLQLPAVSSRRYRRVAHVNVQATYWSARSSVESVCVALVRCLLCALWLVVWPFRAVLWTPGRRWYSATSCAVSSGGGVVGIGSIANGAVPSPVANSTPYCRQRSVGGALQPPQMTPLTRSLLVECSDSDNNDTMLVYDDGRTGAACSQLPDPSSWTPSSFLRRPLSSVATSCRVTDRQLPPLSLYSDSDEVGRDSDSGDEGTRTTTGSSAVGRDVSELQLPEDGSPELPTASNTPTLHSNGVCRTPSSIATCSSVTSRNCTPRNLSRIFRGADFEDGCGVDGREMEVGSPVSSRRRHLPTTVLPSSGRVAIDGSSIGRRHQPRRRCSLRLHDVQGRLRFDDPSDEDIGGASFTSR